MKNVLIRFVSLLLFLVLIVEYIESGIQKDFVSILLLCTKLLIVSFYTEMAIMESIRKEIR